MNDPANTIQWNTGYLVIHDADAKNRKMLMEVLGYLINGRVVTRYVNVELNDKYKKQNRWVNGIEVLHDPRNYGIVPDADDDRAERK